MYQASITWQGEPWMIINTIVGEYKTHKEAYSYVTSTNVRLKLQGEQAILFIGDKVYKVLTDDDITLDKQKPETYKNGFVDENDYDRVSIPIKNWHKTDGFTTGFESLAYSILNKETGQYEINPPQDPRKPLFTKRQNDYRKFVEQLIAFQSVHNHVNVPQMYNDKQLARKVKYARECYWKDKLKKEDIAELESLGFQWKIKSTSSDNWAKFILLLAKFKNENGHCIVSNSHSNIWLVQQVYKTRYRYKKKLLSSDKIKKLEKMGFSWEIHQNKESYQKILDEFQL